MVTAQVSLYPLRQETVAPVLGGTVELLREAALEVKPDTVSTLLVGDENAIFAAIQGAFHHAARQSPVLMVVTLSSGGPAADRSRTKPTTHGEKDPA